MTGEKSTGENSAHQSFWRRRASIWLRVLFGLLIFPIVWLVSATLLDAAIPAPPPSVTLTALFVVGAIIAAALSWLIARRASGRGVVILGTLALLGYVLAALMAIPTYQSYDPSARLPQFPWPPPKTSATYVLPGTLLEDHDTVGDATDAILSALETKGYVERSFFRTQHGGVALVTRLERINEDGSSAADLARWPASDRRHSSGENLYGFLRGLFYIDSGRYRVIVFVLQDLPFSQGSDGITAAEARAWLASGANVLPSQIARRPLGDAHCTALIYEFASDGEKVRVVESTITGKDHLDKSGVMAALDGAS